ncbi:MAG: thioredoxin-dependent thiol peroxidase [Gammaproteobacteria bacterium]|nr:thioredoxin-dependent thiol peroxidase [Gammaproteobacteria bacterium]MYK42507.1 thioredoxin-dependent thiol peroxidase [Gammaproteobacteria bacterium]
MSIEVGQLAPEFTLQDSEGKSVSLSDLRGQNVVVYFYPKDDTPGCTKESCGFRDLWGEFKNHNTVVIGISPDNEASHRKFVSKYDLPFTLLCDPDLKVMKQYGAYGEKTLYGRKMMGVIRSTVLIDAKGFIIKHWKRVSKAAEHPSKVLDALSIST